MHKVSPSGSASCCSWRCLHVPAIVVRSYPFKAKKSLLSKKKKERKATSICELHGGKIFCYYRLSMMGYDFEGLKNNCNMQVPTINMKWY